MTEASLREVAARNERADTQWVYDVLDSWLVSSEGEEPVPTSSQGGAQSRFGWSWAGFRLLARAEDGEQERRVVADLP